MCKYVARLGLTAVVSWLPQGIMALLAARARDGRQKCPTHRPPQTPALVVWSSSETGTAAGAMWMWFQICPFTTTSHLSSSTRPAADGT